MIINPKFASLVVLISLLPIASSIAVPQLHRQVTFQIGGPTRFPDQRHQNFRRKSPEPHASELPLPSSLRSVPEHATHNASGSKDTRKGAKSSHKHIKGDHHRNDREAGEPKHHGHKHHKDVKENDKRSYHYIISDSPGRHHRGHTRIYIGHHGHSVTVGKREDRNIAKKATMDGDIPMMKTGANRYKLKLENGPRSLQHLDPVQALKYYRGRGRHHLKRREFPQEKRGHNEIDIIEASRNHRHGHPHSHTNGDSVIVLEKRGDHSHTHVHSHGGKVKIIQDGNGHSHSHVHVHRDTTQGEIPGFNIHGVAGTIDIVSPTVDNPTGSRIASLIMSSDPSEANQFVLNASGTVGSTLYLVVKESPSLAHGNLPVALEIPVYDQSKAIYVLYCATFDPDPPMPSPLMATECVKDKLSVDEHSSQAFSYNPATGIIRPLWLKSLPIDGAPLQARDAACDGDSEHAASSDAHQTPQNVSLVFTPAISSSTPVLNSQESIVGPKVQNVISDPSPSLESVEPTMSSELVPSNSNTGTIVASDTSSSGPFDATPTVNKDQQSRTTSPSDLPLETPTKKIEGRGDEIGANDDAGQDTDVDDPDKCSEQDTSEDDDRPSDEHPMSTVDTGYQWRFKPNGVNNGIIP